RRPTSPGCITARAATSTSGCSVSPADDEAWHCSVVRRFILRRLAVMPLLLLGIVTIAFCISRLIPADPLASIVGERQLNNEKIVNAAKTRWGLNGSLPEQYVIYVKNLAKGDLGTSFRTRKPVAHDLLD